MEPIPPSLAANWTGPKHSELACGFLREPSMGKSPLTSVIIKGGFMISGQSILTGWQCLQLTTGVLKRWSVYYSPSATLIRLFALQGMSQPHSTFAF